MIKISSNENDTILDPYCGSGSFLVAAKILKRNYIGVDLKREYTELSQDRIKSISNTLF